MKNSFAINLDRIGMCTSAICAVHCLALPILLLMGAETVIQYGYSEISEHAILIFVFLIGVFSFIPGFLQHRQHHVLVLFSAGFLLLLLGESLADPTMSLLVPVFGAGLVIYAHFLNITLKKKSCSC